MSVMPVMGTVVRGQAHLGCRVGLGVLVLALAGCATGPGPAPVVRTPPPEGREVMRGVGSRLETERPAVRRVRLTGEFFSVREEGRPLPPRVANARVRVDFQGKPKVGDLFSMFQERGLLVYAAWDDGSIGGTLEASGVQIRPGASAFGSVAAAATGVGVGIPGPAAAPGAVQAGADPGQGVERVTREVQDLGEKQPPLMDRPLPFQTYTGTVGGLMRLLESSLGVAVSWDGGIRVSPLGRYSVMLPQSVEIMNAVVAELRAKGARNVVASTQAGTVSFMAPPPLVQSVIRPYLVRLGRNMSEVVMQVALVSVALNDSAGRGFDWSKLNLRFAEAAAGGGAGGGDGGGTTPRPSGDLFVFRPDAAQVVVDGIRAFGSRYTLDVAGVIQFLSTFGSTRVEQNVELRTLSGTVVAFRAGETIPFIGQVSAGTQPGIGIGGVGAGASAQFLETGLNIRLAPLVESSGGLVTVTFDLELRDLVEFVQLSAGREVGTLTVPRTRDQKLNDIVRIPIGETVILGGLRRQLSSESRNAPFRVWGLGNLDRRADNSALFIIIRPTVTFYEVAGLDVPLPGRLSDSATNIGMEMGEDTESSLLEMSRQRPVERRVVRQPELD